MKDSYAVAVEKYFARLIFMVLLASPTYAAKNFPTRKLTETMVSSSEPQISPMHSASLSPPETSD